MDGLSYEVFFEGRGQGKEGQEERSDADELVLFLYRGHPLYRGESPEGALCRIRTAPRRFFSLDLEDRESVRVYYWSGCHGARLFPPDWERKRGAAPILDQGETVRRARALAGTKLREGEPEELERFWESSREAWGSYGLGQGGYWKHRGSFDCDWAMDHLEVHYGPGTFAIGGCRIHRVKADSHWDFGETGKPLMETIRGSAWSRERFEDWIRTLDTYDTFVEMEGSEGSGGGERRVLRRIRLDGGRRREWSYVRDGEGWRALEEE